ncbi:hypothetical protein [Nostoc piscinale]|uniref:hypothetical protein n=1 Tax=Nostoc piscinale TaxID=224012 RepID=UPI0039A76B0E
MNEQDLDVVRSQILKNPRNTAILQFLQMTADSYSKLLSWEQAYSGFDEGGQIFFDKYGRELPNSVKYSLGIHNLMINPQNYLIFAAHYGRCTFFFRPDWKKLEIQNTDQLRISETLDGLIDIRILGKEWAILNCFCEDEEDNLVWAYSHSSNS